MLELKRFQTFNNEWGPKKVSIHNDQFLFVDRKTTPSIHVDFNKTCIYQETSFEQKGVKNSFQQDFPNCDSYIVGGVICYCLVMNIFPRQKLKNAKYRF